MGSRKRKFWSLARRQGGIEALIQYLQLLHCHPRSRPLLAKMPWVVSTPGQGRHPILRLCLPWTRTSYRCYYNSPWALDTRTPQPQTTEVLGLHKGMQLGGGIGMDSKVTEHSTLSGVAIVGALWLRRGLVFIEGDEGCGGDQLCQVSKGPGQVGQ